MIPWLLYRSGFATGVCPLVVPKQKGERGMGEANRLGRSGVLAAAVLLVVGVLVLAAVAQPAKAAFPGQNGDIAYAKFSPSSEEARIFTMNPDGSEQTLLEPGSSPSYSPRGCYEL
jgi:hypothetical protein